MEIRLKLVCFQRNKLVSSASTSIFLDHAGSLLLVYIIYVHPVSNALFIQSFPLSCQYNQSYRDLGLINCTPIFMKLFVISLYSEKIP